MRFEVLGSLRVRTPAGIDVVVRSRHERTVLAVLLFRVGQAVTADQLVIALWPDQPPASHMSNLHTYLSRLRSRLPEVAIEQVNGSYRLQVGADDVDLLTFRREITAGRAALARGDTAMAVTRFRQGLAQWRGQPLADLSVSSLGPEIAQLEAEWLSAVEDCIDAELALGESGRGNEVLAELHGLVMEHPLRERLHGLLMVALCLAGRRADALTAYQTARDTLTTELGIEPGPELRRLHQAILRGEEVAFAVRARPAPQVSPAVFPVCQLPLAVAEFVGRADSIEQAARLVAPRENAVPLLAISGPPGVGKSALVVRVAHQLRAAFPDGQIFAHLAGAAQPRDPAEVLGELLRSLGVPASAVPQDLAALSTAYRARLADRRVLVVFDDVADPAQVRALLPGTPGSAVLVTSRSRLSGLTDAAHLQLGPLTDAEAHQLLVQVAGRDRLTDEQEQAARITRACGNLPLALRIAGTRLATQMTSVATLADRLDDQHRRLSELAVSDQQVRASLALSVQALSGTARAAFALLHLIGPVSFTAWSVTALLGRPDADRVLDELTEASLLDPVHPASGESRYRLPDLLRVYSAELTPADDPAGLAALRRLLAATVVAAESAASRIPRTLTWSRLSETVLAQATANGTGPGGASPVGAVDQPVADPLGWLNAERALLVGLVATARAAGADREALQLAERLAPYLWIGGHWADLQAVHRMARQAAERTGNERAYARMDLIAGVLQLVRGDLDAADASLAASQAAFERLGDRHGLACVLADQAIVCSNYRVERGAHAVEPGTATAGAEEAVRIARRAIDLFNAEGDQLGAVLTAPGLSAALRRLGRLTEALDIDLAAAATACRIDAAPVVVARCLNALALSRLLTGQLQPAYSSARNAVDLLQATGERYVRVAALHHLALVAISLGRREEAVRLLTESHELAVELGDRLWATGLERDLAASRIGAGSAAAAIPTLHRCLHTFQSMGLRSARAATLDVLACAHDALGESAAANAARQRATLLANSDDHQATVLSAIVRRLAVPPGSLGPAKAARYSPTIPTLAHHSRETNKAKVVVPRR